MGAYDLCVGGVCLCVGGVCMCVGLFPCPGGLRLTLIFGFWKPSAEESELRSDKCRRLLSLAVTGSPD